MIMRHESEEIKRVLQKSSENSVKKLSGLVKDSKMKLFDEPAEGKEVTFLSMRAKDCANSSINIHTTQGLRWISDESEILEEKRENIRLMMEVPETKTVDLLRSLNVTPFMTTNFGLPVNTIDSKIVVLYHEDDLAGVRKAIAIHYPSLARFIDEVYLERYNSAYSLKEIWTAEFQCLIRSVTGKTVEAIKEPELLQEASWENLGKVTRSKKYDVYRALLYLQTRDDRLYTLGEITRVADTKYKTVHHLLKNEFEKGKPVRDELKMHRCSKDFEIVHAYHRTYLVRLTDSGKKAAMLYHFYDLLQKNA